MSTLRGGLSMAMCGHAFWSHDMGGFHRTPTPDLYVRWSQMGFFSPMSRAHGMSSRLPWDYGETAERIFRDYDRLRYRLAPYLYHYYVEASQTGLPVIRPMVLEFQNDPTTYTMDLQYMFGEHLLMAPVYNREGNVRVYLPEGQWVDYWTHAVYSGPNWITVQAPLDVLPIYVRAGCIDPDRRAARSLRGKDVRLRDVRRLPAGKCDVTLNDMDGETALTLSQHNGTLDVSLRGAKKTVGLRLMPLLGAGGVENVTVNGKPLARKDNVTLDASSEVGWTRGADGILRAVIVQ